MKKCILTLMALTIVGAIIANSRLLSATSFFTNETEANEPTNVATSPALAAEDETVDSIAAAIVTRSDVDLTFTNDETYPWTINGNEIKNGNCGIKNSTSTLTVTYKSNYTTEFYYGCTFNNYSNHFRTTYVDGKIITSQRFFIEPGEHVIVFKDSIGNSTSTSNYYYITNLWVKEIQPLETAVLSENSQPLTFKNDGEWPWTIEDGYIQNSNYGIANSASKFSTTFTITEPSKSSFYSSTYYYDSNNSASTYFTDNYFDFKINGIRYMGRNNGAGTTSLLLEPGEYTMEWRDTLYSKSYKFISRVSNIELSSNWIDVELSTPGTLGVEVLYKVDVLNDVELLKVKGTLNEVDWTNINQMKNLIGLDLTEAKFDVVPEKAFYGLSRLSSVKLPEGVKTIGASAFVGTQLLNIDIPNSVTSIGTNAFSQTRVRTVNFKEDSHLQSIGYNAFYQCTSLKEFIMPNTVTNLNTNNSSNQYCGIFNGCTNLKKLIFSDAITSLPRDICRGCSAITELHLPQNIETIGAEAFYQCSKLRKIEFPSSLRTISSSAFYQCGLDSVCLPLKLSSLGQYAFQDCDNLKYIELPSYITYNYNFQDCGSIETVVCPSATPPSIKNDPFYNARSKSAITLKVPSFAVVNYKLDPYWYQFGSIVEGDDIDYWKITSELSLTNNRRMNGKPDIDLYYGGKLRVGGNAPMPTADFNYYVSEGNPGCLINDCPDMTAENLSTKFSVSADTWYFFTPIHDIDLTKVSHSANASYVFRYYDSASRGTNGTGSSWKNVDTGKLVAGQGYIFRCNANGVITLPAEAAVHEQFFNTEDLTTPLYAYESTASANRNWNYVGNPFPAYFDVYYMDFTAPITVWTGSTYKAYSIVDDNYVLRPMQSFFVQKPDEIDKIIFHKEGRQFTSTVSRASYASPRAMATEDGNRFLFDIQISNEEDMIDETRVVINDKALCAYEIEKDASKFMTMENGVPQLFTLDADGNTYAINERPVEDGNVALGYRAAQSGFYTISIVKAAGSVLLYDKKMNKTVDLTTQDYTFYSEATETVDATRFTLIFGHFIPTGISNADHTRTSVTASSGCIEINGAEGQSVMVFSTDGRCVYNGTLKKDALRVDVANGAYIVKVADTAVKTVVTK